eukprot:668262-Alexandrium_andersonii.AAC.1
MRAHGRTHARKRARAQARAHTCLHGSGQLSHQQKSEAHDAEACATQTTTKCEQRSEGGPGGAGPSWSQRRCRMRVSPKHARTHAGTHTHTHTHTRTHARTHTHCLLYTSDAADDM